MKVKVINIIAENSLGSEKGNDFTIGKVYDASLDWGEVFEAGKTIVNVYDNKDFPSALWPSEYEVVI